MVGFVFKPASVLLLTPAHSSSRFLTTRLKHLGELDIILVCIEAVSSCNPRLRFCGGALAFIAGFLTLVVIFWVTVMLQNECGTDQRPLVWYCVMDKNLNI